VFLPSSPDTLRHQEVKEGAEDEEGKDGGGAKMLKVGKNESYEET